jgi:hypothetical protein
MDGYTSNEGNAQSRLQWSFLPCKPISGKLTDDVALCNTDPNYDIQQSAVNIAASQSCGSRGANPFLSCPLSQGTSGSLEASMQNYIPGQPMGRQIGAPFKSTECNPTLVSAKIPGPKPVQQCNTMGCQVMYENKVKCDRWSGPVNRYFNYPCQCPSSNLSQTNDYMGTGSCAGSGTNTGCCAETCPAANYRQLLKANYPFC